MRVSAGEFPEIHTDGSRASMFWVLENLTTTPVNAPGIYRDFPVVRLWAILQWHLRGRVARGAVLWPR